MTRNLLLCLVAMASGLSLAADTYQGAKEGLQVYLLIGQSNMAGRAPIPKEDAGPIPRCFLLDDQDEWEAATNPLNRYSTIRKSLGMQKMNPGYGFAKAMLAKEPSVSIGLVVNAKGGSKIEDWAKGKPFYEEALKRAAIAQKTGTLKGILWHQGESNGGDAEYLKKLTKLVTDLRKDLGMPELPFVAGQVNERNGAVVNAQIAKLPDALPFTGFAASSGLTLLDNAHFDTRSMKLLGERYAEAMQRLDDPAAP